MTRMRERGREGEKGKNRDKREEDGNQSGYFFTPVTELLFGWMLFSLIKQQRGRQFKNKIAKSISLQMHLFNHDCSFACCIKGLHSISFNHQCDLVCSPLSTFIWEWRRYMFIKGDQRGMFLILQFIVGWISLCCFAANTDRAKGNYTSSWNAFVCETD